MSIFIENELEPDGFKFTWFNFGFHNLANTTALNFQVGNLSPLDFASYPNRLRIMAPIKGDVFGVTTTGGAAAADNLSVSGFRPGIQYYGYGGSLIWWAGVTPGRANEVNDQQHYWGGVRLDIPGVNVDFEGSNVSVWTYRGTDTVPRPSGPLNDIQNDFDRWSVQGNLRWRQADIQAAWVEGTDDNWDLSRVSPPQVEFSGIALVGAWQAGRWYPAVAYDKVRQDDAPAAVLTAAQQRLEKEFTTVSLSYHPRENWRVGAFWRIDMLEESPLIHPLKRHDFRVNVRTMF